MASNVNKYIMKILYSMAVDAYSRVIDLKKKKKKFPYIWFSFTYIDMYSVQISSYNM